MSVVMLAALGWQYPRALPLVAVLIVVLTIGAVVFYMPQSARLRGRWRWGLPTLRAMALSALAVSLLQPVIFRAPKPMERGAIVIVVDHSNGMGIDDQRGPAQLVALADGMGFLPPGLRRRGDDIANSLQTIRVKHEDVSTAHSSLAFATLRRYTYE